MYSITLECTATDNDITFSNTYSSEHTINHASVIRQFQRDIEAEGYVANVTSIKSL